MQSNQDNTAGTRSEISEQTPLNPLSSARGAMMSQTARDTNFESTQHAPGVAPDAMLEPKPALTTSTAADIENLATGMPLVTVGERLDTNPTATAPEPKKPDFKDAMTFGEQLLYEKCLRRIAAYEEIVKATTSEDILTAIVHWTADTTFLLSKDDASLQLNLVACTQARALADSKGEYPGDIPVQSVISTAKHLHSRIEGQVSEFRRRDPQTYQPTESWIKRAWADLDCEWEHWKCLQFDVSRYCYHKHPDSSLAHRISLEWFFVQFLLWFAVTLMRAAVADKKGAPLPVSSGTHLMAVVFPVLVLLIMVKCCAQAKWLWKYVLRASWLAYSLWFAFAMTADDLKYLVAPLLLLMVMYALHWRKVILPVWVTYVIGVSFMLITFIIYIMTEAPITWKNFLLMFYLYNTWIATHLDVVLSKLIRRIFTRNDNLGTSEFMSWYIFATGLIFHFLTVILITMLMTIVVLFIICACMYCSVKEQYDRAMQLQTVEYTDDFFGFNRRAAQAELERKIQEAELIRATAPGQLACLMGMMTMLMALFTFILVCILVPSPCMFREKVVKPIKQRFSELDPEDEMRLNDFHGFVANFLNQERMFPK